MFRNDVDRENRVMRFIRVALDGSDTPTAPPTEIQLDLDARQRLKQFVSGTLRKVLSSALTAEDRSFYLRLIYHAVPVGERIRAAGLTAADRLCGCQSGLVQSRAHLFWDCPLALTVRSCIEHHLYQCGFPRTFRLSRHHLWLLQVPFHGADAERLSPIWPLICLTALATIDDGRKRMYASRDTPIPLAALSSWVKLRFWDRLRDLSSLWSANETLTSRLRDLLPSGPLTGPSRSPFIAWNQLRSIFEVSV
jgi:hypothetical protein